MVDYGLSGKVALVTGVSRNIGIGAAISRYLAASGANVFTKKFVFIIKNTVVSIFSI
ncbi:MAG: hypothetical protein WA959_00090 [Rivularia sp. (in: cyanobacteria)]